MDVTFEAAKYPRKQSVDYYSKVTKRYERVSAGDRYYDPSRVFISVSGETVFEQLTTRRQRPYTTLRPIVEEKLREAGVNFTKIRWSQKAGCRMCPCSPGFIIEGDEGRDFWLTIEHKEDGVAK